MARISEASGQHGRLKPLVDDVWAKSKSSDVLLSFNPATGERIAEVPLSTAEETSHAVEAAHAAFESWKNVPILERVKYLFKMRAAFEKHADKLVAVNTENHGKTLEESRGDVGRMLENIDTATTKEPQLIRR